MPLALLHQQPLRLPRSRAVSGVPLESPKPRNLGLGILCRQGDPCAGKSWGLFALFSKLAGGEKCPAGRREELSQPPWPSSGRGTDPVFIFRGRAGNKTQNQQTGAACANSAPLAAVPGQRQRRVRGESWHQARRGFQAQGSFQVKRKKSKTWGDTQPQPLRGVFLKKAPKSTFSSSQFEVSPFPAPFLGSLPCPEETPAAPDTPKSCTKGQSGFGTTPPWFSLHLIPSLICRMS